MKNVWVPKIPEAYFLKKILKFYELILTLLQKIFKLLCLKITAFIKLLIRRSSVVKTRTSVRSPLYMNFRFGRNLAPHDTNMLALCVCLVSVFSRFYSKIWLNNQKYLKNRILNDRSNILA